MTDAEIAHYHRLLEAAKEQGRWHRDTYGPCDALGPHYTCSVCNDNIMTMAADRKRLEALETWQRRARFVAGYAIEALHHDDPGAVDICLTSVYEGNLDEWRDMSDKAALAAREEKT